MHAAHTKLLYSKKFLTQPRLFNLLAGLPHTAQLSHWKDTRPGESVYERVVKLALRIAQ